MDKRTLIIGIGNSSRGDDGLGWKFLDELPARGGVDLEYRYQLQVEDAALISSYDEVIFVDAIARALPEGFAFSPCEPKQTSSFTTHRLEPGAVLWLCRELYRVIPDAYVMAIEGVDFQLGQSLSTVAERNLTSAKKFMEQQFSSREGENLLSCEYNSDERKSIKQE
ncbi:MAG: hydrogenase maturation protease [Cyclobacteriaceae bacterium]|nr:hydrogenase maturation protease [Cyclobacteriaceae bacterium]